MTLERIITRLIGQAEPGEGAANPLPAAESRALSQRLRASVDGEAGDAAKDTDRGPAADALRLAAYLDGSMSTAEREAFEAELTRSPSRRDELIAAAAWIDEVAARQTTPPADVTALAIALETAAPAQTRHRGAGFAGLIEWLLPRPRLAIATSALASIAIVAVGIDIALHTNPQFRQVIPVQSAPSPIGEIAVLPGDNARERLTRLPSANDNPDRPLPPPARIGDPITLTAEIINALIAYRDDPTPARQKTLLTALARAGSAPIPADQVRAIMLQPQLYERLTQPRSGLPAYISARFSVGGELIIAIAN